MRVSRADQSQLARWWFTVDHALLMAIVTLVVAGIVLSLAASPAVALKKGLPTYYFVKRQMIFGGLGLFIMAAVSLLPPAGIRRLALVLLAASLAGLVAVQLVGAEINGARRWISIAGHSVQPSEFAKPAFVVLSAWLFAEAQRRPDMPALPMAILLLVVLASLLLIQPDVGQTMLICAAWGVLYFAAGQPIAGAAVLGAVATGALVGAYFTLDYIRMRFDRFFQGLPSDNSQIGRAIQSFGEGGFLGRGPGEGVVKTVLPDAHSDFIFAVVAEEYGVLACLVLLGLFAFIVMRAIAKVDREADLSIRLAVIGLAVIFGLQALTNMAVNVGLLPAKGMTLPFISAGGSSTLAVSVTLGMVLALTRRRADPMHLKKPRLVPTIEAFEGPTGTGRGVSSGRG